MRCAVCGKSVPGYQYKEIISEDLSRKWNLSKIQREKFNKRESLFCPYCKSSARDRLLAKALLILFPSKRKNLIQWIHVNNGLSIAEINSCGSLHKYLKHLSNNHYSEYKTNNIYRFLIDRIVYRAKEEDIQSLSYKSNMFDLVIHSETLEHVPDPVKALSECRRVLKYNGKCLFTIPLIHERKTKNVIDTSSYHGKKGDNAYLVHWEFGGDFIKKNAIKIVCGKKDQYNQVFLIEK